MPGGPMPNGGYCPDKHRWDEDSYSCVPSGTETGGQCDPGFEQCGDGCKPIGTCGSTPPDDNTGPCPSPGMWRPGGPGTPCVPASSGTGGVPAGGGGTGEGGDWPSYFGPRSIAFNFGPAPKFIPPQFKQPTLEEAQNEPGYAFARDEGQRALEQSAAGKGVLRTGGTLKDITAWGNKFAEQNYGNVFNRALQTFDRLYRGAWDAFTPQLTEWQTNAAGKQRAGELGFNRAWDLYLSEIEKYKYNNPSATDLLNAELNS